MNLELWNRRDAEGGHIPDATEDPLYLHDVEWVAITYFDLVRVKFTSTKAAAKAKEKTGWENWEDDTLELNHENGLVFAGSEYYADWGTNNE